MARSSEAFRESVDKTPGPTHGPQSVGFGGSLRGPKRYMRFFGRHLRGALYFVAFSGLILMFR